MDLSGYMDSVISFAQNNTIIAIAVGLGLLIFLYRKPKLFFFLLFIGVFLAAVFYMITSLAGPGAAEKRRLLQDDGKQSNRIY
jgi:hypothetical protein